MKKQQLVAAGVLAAVVLWMALPPGIDPEAQEAQQPQREVSALPEGANANENPNVVAVRARRVQPQSYVERIRVRGRTQAYRLVEVRAEQSGRIVTDPVPRGARVNAGDVLCEIAIDNRDADLQEAEARRDQAVQEYEAALDLRSRNLQSEVAVAQLKAAVEASNAAVSRAELALKNTRMVAPFDGLVETRTVEVGDLLSMGGVCATVLDDDPMMLVGLVPEQQVSRIEPGARVFAETVGGQRLTGRVTFLASSADPISRSYRMEVTVDPTGTKVRDGITVEMAVNAAEIEAYRIPSSALSLDDAGEIGVKTIDANNQVRFNNITIVGDETDQIDPGIWVTGLQGTVTLITLGQEIVFDGQTVGANFDWSEQQASR